MLPAERRQRILEDIIRNRSLRIKNLSQEYNVSEMTIRRDLEYLEEEEFIKRTHGGAIYQPRSSMIEPAFSSKQSLQRQEKIRIAQFTCENIVENNDNIILEGGTTVSFMARYLTSKKGLTVVTNGFYTTDELRRLLPNATIINSGGILRSESLTFVGPVGERFFQEFYANKLFLSATGLTLESGFSDPNLLETQIKKAMIASSDQVIVLLDSSKFGKRSLTSFLPAKGADILITDEGAPEQTVLALRELGVKVQIVPE
jgi:DeoR/GlpR family transcriptional regulator of sugar metabolism